MAGMFCVESDGDVGCSAALRRSFVVRVASSEERLGLAGDADASSASGLAGCVGGNGGRGVVAHPANRARTAKNGKIREMNMDCQCS
jgi:hypothetical protein